MRHGLQPALAGRLVAETMAGTAALLAARDYDTLAVRREVTSPGGSTARGLDALERGGVRGAFQDAMDARRAGAALMLALATTRGDIANYVERAVHGLHPPDLHLHPAQPAVLVRRAAAVLALDRRRPQLPARRLRAVSADLPPAPPADRVFDLTPMIAIIVLYIVRTIIVNAIAG